MQTPRQYFELLVKKPKKQKKNEWEEEIINTIINNTLIWNRVIGLNKYR